MISLWIRSSSFILWIVTISVTLILEALLIIVDKLLIPQFTKSKVEFNQKQANRVTHGLAQNPIRNQLPIINWRIP